MAQRGQGDNDINKSERKSTMKIEKINFVV